MSLDASRLERVRELPGGMVQARCPACAEGGHDHTGEHLRIYPDGRFGCCVHPRDKEHRRRIFALVGVRQPGTFTVRLKAPTATRATRSVKAALTAFKSGTLGTPKPESGNGVPNVPSSPVADFGTLGTGNFELRARARGDSIAHIDIGEDFQEELKDLENGVPSVPKAVAAEPLSAAGERLPYLTPGGSLVIPFDSPERYHWWKPDGERLSVAKVRAGLATHERMNHAVTV